MSLDDATDPDESRDVMARTVGGDRPAHLTAMQRRFVAAMVDLANGTQAAIRAGCKPKHAATTAYKWQRLPEVAAALAEARQRAAEAAGWTQARAVAHLTPIVEADIGDLMTPDGRMRPLSEIPPSVRRAIASIKVRVKPGKQTWPAELRRRLRRVLRERDFDNAELLLQEMGAAQAETPEGPTLEVVEVKLWDKLTALDQISRHFGFYKSAQTQDCNGNRREEMAAAETLGGC